MNITQKRLGIFLIGLSIILIVSLSFMKANIDKRNAFLCEAVSSNPNMDMTECPAHNDNTSWLILIAFGVSFVMFIAGIYTAFTPMKKEVRKIDTSKLDEEEKKVYNLLKIKEGSMYQSDIIKELDVSKVKLTRILDKMEGKQVIERKRRGMTNIVILK